MRVLMSAYACQPGRGSEPAVGWNWVNAAARRHEVWVITRSNNRAAVESAAPGDATGPVHWVYYDIPGLALARGAEWFPAQVYYYLWQKGAARTALKLCREVRFDLAHHVTFGTYWMPSFLPRTRLPYVWGPVGGGDLTPASFLASLPPISFFYECLRSATIRMFELVPSVRRTARNSAVAVASTLATRERLESMGCRNAVVMSQLSLPEAEIGELSGIPGKTGGPFRLISVGRLLGMKGFHYGLRAFADSCSRHGAMEYWIVGDGPERKSLEKLARKLGVADKTRFWGWVPRPEINRLMKDCDVMLYPCLHDSGGLVCLEAMAAGRPVICLDRGGQTHLIAPGTGIRIPARRPSQVVADLAGAIDLLSGRPEIREAMAEEGRKLVREKYATGNIGDKMDALYESAGARGPAGPGRMNGPGGQTCG